MLFILHLLHWSILSAKEPQQKTAMKYTHHAQSILLWESATHARRWRKSHNEWTETFHSVSYSLWPEHERITYHHISQTFYCVLGMQITWGKMKITFYSHSQTASTTATFPIFQPMNWAASVIKGNITSEYISSRCLCFVFPDHFTGFILGKFKTHKIKWRTRSSGGFLIKTERKNNFSSLEFFFPTPGPYWYWLNCMFGFPKRKNPD